MVWLKSKSAFSNLISATVAIIFLFISLFVSIRVIGDMNLAVLKSRIEREYILAMESDGYLTPEKLSMLRDELTNLGVYNLDFSGTTFVAAGYGNPIYLSVHGLIKLNDIRGISGFSFIKGDSSFEFKINQKSTAKY